MFFLGAEESTESPPLSYRGTLMGLVDCVLNEGAFTEALLWVQGGHLWDLLPGDPSLTTLGPSCPPKSHSYCKAYVFSWDMRTALLATVSWYWVVLDPSWAIPSLTLRFGNGQGWPFHYPGLSQFEHSTFHVLENPSGPSKGRQLATVGWREH